jgi:hypothetical protein
MRQAHYTPKEALIHLALEPENDTPRAWYRKYAALWTAGLTPIRRGKRVKLLRSEVEALKAEIDQGRVLITASGKVERLKGMLAAMVLLLVFASCSSVYNLSDIRGHYTPNDTACTCPRSIDIYAGPHTATITMTDSLDRQTMVSYIVAPDSQLCPATERTAREYTMKVGKGGLTLKDSRGRKYTYTRQAQ